MIKRLTQVEKNTQASFGYVKKDLLMVNDAISDLHDKVQHLSLNHAALLQEMKRLKEEIQKCCGRKVKQVKVKKVQKSSKKKK